MLAIERLPSHEIYCRILFLLESMNVLDRLDSLGRNLAEGMRTWCVRWGYKRLEADLTHEVLINLKRKRIKDCEDKTKYSVPGVKALFL